MEGVYMYDERLCRTEDKAGNAGLSAWRNAGCMATLSSTKAKPTQLL